MSSFAENYVQSLLSAAHSSKSLSSLSQEIVEEQVDVRDEKLEGLLVQLKSYSNRDALHASVRTLHEADGGSWALSSSLRAELETRIIVGIYAEALDQCLKEAIEFDSEAEWWDNVGRTSTSVSSYLLATLPERLKRSLDTIVNALRTQNIPIRPSSLSLRTFNQLFPNVGSFRPSALRTAFFPHLAHQPQFFFLSPLDLTRQECEKRREKLLELRDRRAEQLGKLLLLKAELESLARHEGWNYVDALARLHQNITGAYISNQQGTPATARELLLQTLPFFAASHRQTLSTLRRPSKLTLIWPRLALIPIVSIIAFRTIYNSRSSITESALELHDTMKGFWFGYVVEPIRGILDTVRTGGDNGTRIVNDEAVRADLESLERMAVALAKEKLSLNDSQIREMTEQIRLGDLTPVLRIYEEDIKSPVRKAISGSLIRSLLIQIQKAKVDLDQALTGIDRLLKSQELTFAFVGVAPSLAIVYAALSSIRTLWSGRSGSKRYGGHQEREAAWLAIRQVERILITEPSPNPEGEDTSSITERQSHRQLSPVTSGLLIIALTRLRNFAEKRLRVRSLLREEILADIRDLEDPMLAREEKLRVVERMWRSFGGSLGWQSLGRLH